MICSKCTVSISNKSPGVECKICAASFHCKCVGVDIKLFKSIDSSGGAWICKECNNKSGRRRSFIVQQDGTGVSTDLNNTAIVASTSTSGMPYTGPASLQSVQDLVLVLKSELSDFKLEVLKLRKDNADLLDSIKFCCGKIDDFQSEILVLKEENANLKSSVSRLTQAHDVVEQRLRSNNLELSGVPQAKGENLTTIISSVGATLQCPIREADIMEIHRVNHFDSSVKYPRNIIVSLSTKAVRDNLLAAAKLKRGIFATDLGFSSDIEGKIYINEHLTPANKLLFKKTREKARLLNFKYVWVKNGKIFMRKNDTSGIKLINDNITLSAIN